MISSKIVQAILTAQNYPYITKVGVFGSCARDEETVNSDIDILIDYDNSADDFLDDLDNFMEEMERLIDGNIDYVTVAGVMNSNNEAFKGEILRDVKWIYNTESSKPIVSFYIDEEDFEDAVDELNEMGIEIVSGPENVRNGKTIVFVDPDDNKIELCYPKL
jgi:predicted nucleotidyltransferase